MDTELDKKLEEGNKRAAIVTVVIGIIFAIPVIFVNVKVLPEYVILWMILMILIVRYSYKISNKIWKI